MIEQSDKNFYNEEEYQEFGTENNNTSNKDTNNSTQETKKEKKVKKAKKEKKISLSKKSNKKQIERADTLNPVQGQIDVDIIQGNDGNNEEALNDFSVDNIINIKKNDNTAINNKREESTTFVVSKKRGPKKTNPKNKYIHTPDSYDNLMLKRARAFVKSFKKFFNKRCEKYGLDKLGKINVEKVFGLGYKRHKRFLKRRMEIVFGYRNNHNKRVIKKQMVEDEIFASFMKMKVKEAFIYYEANYPYLHLKNCRILVSHFKTLANALNKKEKYCSREEFEKIKKSDFEKAIDKERERRRTPQKKIKKNIYCIRY